MVEPDEKRGGLTHAYCIDPDCHVTGSWRVVINSNPFEDVWVCEAEKSGFMNSARNTPPSSSFSHKLRPRAEMSQCLVIIVSILRVPNSGVGFGKLISFSSSMPGCVIG